MLRVVLGARGVEFCEETAEQISVDEGFAGGGRF